MTDSNLLDIDELQMYFCEPFHINDKITIYIPTIGDIVKFGERKYYGMIHTLTCIPSDMKSQLFDMGIDYETLSDFELFAMLTRGLTPESTRLVLGDLDLSKFGLYTSSENDELVLYDQESDIVIDKLIYMKIVEYIRRVHNIKPKIEKAANKTTKKILIQLDRDRIKKSQKEPYKSQLKTLISAMMRYPGFKYKSNELKQCGLYEFMDTVQGAQIYVSSTSLLQGSYSGMIDCSKINKKEFNWMRSLDD
jgi:hypothetical protein